VLTASTCTGKICGRAVKTNSGFMVWTPGKSLLNYSERERAALAWTEAVTNLHDGHVSDEVYERVRNHFSGKELADLTFAVAAINAWNRLAISARTVPGTYQPVVVTEDHPRQKSA